MASQIFKKVVPSNILFNLLEKICSKNKNFYIINKNAYKRAQHYNILEQFYESIKPYYHLSKLFYITRTQKYCRFTTIVRQICKINALSFTSEIKYDKSKYDIIYYIYF